MSENMKINESMKALCLILSSAFMVNADMESNLGSDLNTKQLQRKELLLSGPDWQLFNFAPGEGLAKKAHEKGFAPKEAVTARVPGDVHADLERAGTIENLYYGMNTRDARWVTGKEWWYRKNFSLSPDWKGKNLRLRFEGVDYLGEFWLNGHYLGKHEGQFTPFEFDVTEHALHDGENLLSVLIHPVPEPVRNVISKEGSEWDVMNVMRPAYPYWKSMTSSGWDWGADLVSMGIWKDVRVIASEDVYLSDLTIIPEIAAPYKKATLNIKMDALARKNRKVIVECRSRSLTTEDVPTVVRREVEVVSGENPLSLTQEVSDPRLWWPNGYGDQHLYEMSVAVLDMDGKTLLDETSAKFGIRELKMLQNPRSPMERQYKDYNPDHEPGRVLEFTDATKWPDYLMQINGVSVMGMGANWIPADLLFGRVDEAQYEHLIRLAAAANMNLLRIWGGGLIEKKSFFELCDRYGIMLFSEFPNGGPRLPETDEALTITEQETRQLLPLMMNHPSVVRYGGGNEWYNNAGNSKQMAQLRKICNEVDPSRPFHDSDPETVGQRHGPHGYNYRAHYKTYNTGLPLDTSGPDDPREWTEYGTSGASSVETLKRIMPEANLFPIKPGDPYWQWHKGEGSYGADNWLASSQYKLLFGELPDLQTTVACSQFVQAEGMRYANQSMRRRMWHRSAFASWTFNEPWPNAAHGCLVEYYGKTKMAYYYTKATCAPVDISFVYDNLECRPDQPLDLEVWVSNITNKKMDGSKFRWRIFNTKSEMLWEETRNITIEPRKSNVVGNGRVKWTPTAAMAGEVALVYLELLDSGNKVMADHLYTFGIRGTVASRPAGEVQKPLLKGMLEAKPTKLAITSEAMKTDARGELQTTLEIKNTGDHNGLLVSLDTETKDGYRVYFSDNYLFLPKGQSRKVVVNLLPKGKELPKQGVTISAKAWNSTAETLEITP